MGYGGVCLFCVCVVVCFSSWFGLGPSLGKNEVVSAGLSHPVSLCSVASILN